MKYLFGILAITYMLAVANWLICLHKSNDSHKEEIASLERINKALVGQLTETTKDYQAKMKAANELSASCDRLLTADHIIIASLERELADGNAVPSFKTYRFDK